MSRTITTTLDPFDIQMAREAIREYSQWVQSKVVELQERVATMIANDAREVFNSALSDVLIDESPGIGNVSVHIENDGNVTVVIADGKDAIFMEFGAGVYFNGPVGGSIHPLGVNLGYTIGSYGNGNGAKQVWGYHDENGQLHLTHGVPASMPLYTAVQNVARDIVRIAREVFGNND